MRSWFPPWPWAWLSVTALVLVLDGYSKALASEALELYRPLEVFPWLNMTLAHNYGAAFSFLSQAGGWQRWLFVMLASVVSLVLLVWLLRLPRREWVTGLALSLVLGGAVGNLTDRIRLGYVVDFVDFHIGGWHYPAFNVADSAITCGVILLLVDALLLSRLHKQRNP
jgi:signal peptidase II